MKIVISVFFLSIGLISAQNDKSADEDRTIAQNFFYDLGSMVECMGFAYSRPIHWQKNDFTKLGGVTITAAGLFAIDEESQAFFNRHRADVPRFLLDYGWYYGNPQNNYMLTGAVYAIGLFSANEKLRRVGVLLISSASATGLLQQISKSVVGRARPRSGNGKDTFSPFSSDKDFHSFPSGHAALAFSNAHAIAKQFGSWWIKAPVYTLGIIPGLTRIYERAHWASDVFLSWSLRFFVVESIDLYLNRKYSRTSKTTRKISNMNVALLGTSMRLTYKF